MLTDIKLNPSCSFVDFAIQGEILKIRRWGSRENARGLVLLVHGLGAHSAWFEAAARELAARGFLVLAYDQRGFGSRSDMALHSYKEWIDDLQALVRTLKSSYEGLPFYLLGNSMGALVVMAASRFLDVDGIIICSPGFDGHPQAFSFSYKVKSILTALLAPQREVALPYHFDLVTRDLCARQWMLEDSKKRMAVPAGMLLELLKLSQNVLASLKAVKAPLLMITAGQDKVVNNPLNEKLFGRLAAPSKKHLCIKESWHDLMFDPLIDEVAGEIAAWQGTLGRGDKAALSYSGGAGGQLAQDLPRS